MRVEWYRSATVGIFTSSGSSILCDPWITDGAFIGSWYHWPPLEGFEFESLVEKKWDGIYISHFHADHFDRKLLSAIVRKNQDVKIIIPDYANKWLKRAVLNCGLSLDRIIEIPNNQSIHFKDFQIKVFVADYCNPEICGASISCVSTPRKQSSNDSVALFEADNQRILNANDALAVQSAHRLWPLIGQVDLLLGHFGGAGPFPQCFIDLDENQKLEKASVTGWNFVNRLVTTAESLKARFTMPYAGQYVLGGSLSHLNEFRSVIPMNDVIRRFYDSGVTTPISLKPFAEFDLLRLEISKEWQEPPKSVYENYVEKISRDRFPYQRIEAPWSEGQKVLTRSLQNVTREFQAFVDNGGAGSSSSITIKAGDVFGVLNFGKEQSSVSQKAIYDNHTTIELDLRLLKRLIVRRPEYRGFTQYHFNQAEIGSHLSWKRSGPYPVETQFLNFMQAVASD